MNSTFDVDLKHKEWSLDTHSLYLSRGGGSSAPLFKVPVALPVPMPETLKLESVHMDTISEVQQPTLQDVTPKTPYRVSLKCVCMAYASIGCSTLIGYAIALNHGPLGIHCIMLFMAPATVVTMSLHIITCLANNCKIQGYMGLVFVLWTLPCMLMTQTWAVIHRSFMPQNENIPGAVLNTIATVLAFCTGFGFLALGATELESMRCTGMMCARPVPKWTVLLVCFCVTVPAFTVFDTHHKHPRYEEVLFVMTCITTSLLAILSVLPLLDTSIEMRNTKDETCTQTEEVGHAKANKSHPYTPKPEPHRPEKQKHGRPTHATGV
jgi:hypothetical protein